MKDWRFITKNGTLNLHPPIGTYEVAYKNERTVPFLDAHHQDYHLNLNKTKQKTILFLNMESKEKFVTVLPVAYEREI